MKGPRGPHTNLGDTEQAGLTRGLSPLPMLSSLGNPQGGLDWTPSLGPTSSPLPPGWTGPTPAGDFLTFAHAAGAPWPCSALQPISPAG